MKLSARISHLLEMDDAMNASPCVNGRRVKTWSGLSSLSHLPTGRPCRLHSHFSDVNVTLLEISAVIHINVPQLRSITPS